jgi:hypothetical protein
MDTVGAPFLHKDKNSKDGKINMGPIWDFNLAFGNADYYDGAYVEGWEWDFPCPFGDGGLNPFWWHRLLEDPEYYQHLQCRWKELRTSTFDLSHINALIDSFALVVDSAKERHFTKYPILGTYVWPNAYYPPTFAEEIDTLKNWIAARVNWIDGQFSSGCFPTGIAESQNVAEFNSLLIYPNPAPVHSIIQLQVTVPNDGRVTIDLYDLTGIRLATIFNGELETGVHTISWDRLKDFSPGCFTVIVKTEGHVYSENVMLFRD